jgi:hypothetical protein
MALLMADNSWSSTFIMTRPAMRDCHEDEWVHYFGHDAELLWSRSSCWNRISTTWGTRTPTRRWKNDAGAPSGRLSTLSLPRLCRPRQWMGGGVVGRRHGPIRQQRKSVRVLAQLSQLRGSCRNWVGKDQPKQHNDHISRTKIDRLTQ